MILTMVNPQGVILEDVADKKMKQKDIALTYAYCRRAEIHGERIDWMKINLAITNRWSPSGLLRIKDLAWKHLKRLERA